MTRSDPFRPDLVLTKESCSKDLSLVFIEEISIRLHCQMRINKYLPKSSIARRFFNDELAIAQTFISQQTEI